MSRSRFVAACVLVFMFLGLSHQPAAAQATIKLGTLVPDGSIWHQVLRQLASDWRRATAGRVTLRVYAGTQGDEPTMIRKMRIGQLHAASLTSVGLSAIDPAFNVFGIPMFFDSYEELDYVTDQLEADLKRRLEAKGFLLLNWGNAGWVQIFSRDPVTTVADLKQARIFTSAGEDKMVQWYKENGFRPVPLAMTDMLTSLQTGMIDAIPVTPLAALSFQWYQHIPHMLEAGLGPLVGATVVTRRGWNQVSPEDRTKLLEAAAKSEARLRAEVPKQDQEAIAEMKKRGLKVTSIGAAGGEWTDAAEQFAGTMRGSLVPADVFDAALRARAEFRNGAAAGARP